MIPCPIECLESFMDKCLTLQLIRQMGDTQTRTESPKQHDSMQVYCEDIVHPQWASTHYPNYLTLLPQLSISLQDLSCTFTLIGPPMVQTRRAAWQQHHSVSLSKPTQYVHRDQRWAPKCNREVTATGLQGKYMHPRRLIVLQSVADFADSVSKPKKRRHTYDYRRQ